MKPGPLLSVRSVSKHYEGVVALSEVSFDLEAGSIIAIVGPNGAGKTTLFDVISGYARPDAGNVFVRGMDVTGASPVAIARRGVARTFQTTRLARRLSIRDNLLLAAGGRSNRLVERLGLATPSIELEPTDVVLAELGLAGDTSRIAGGLSFGEQRLLGLAICLVADFDVLLLDEPFAGIQTTLVNSIAAFLRRWQALGKGILIVEHNISAVARISNRMMVLSAGRVFKTGETNEIFRADDVLTELIR
jgi:ABC-type branched-subunit amino acid transport system ATPase component